MHERRGRQRIRNAVVMHPKLKDVASKELIISLRAMFPVSPNLIGTVLQTIRLSSFPTTVSVIIKVTLEQIIYKI